MYDNISYWNYTDYNPVDDNKSFRKAGGNHEYINVFLIWAPHKWATTQTPFIQ